MASAGSDGSVGLWELVPKAPYHPHFVGQFDNGRPESEASALAHDGLLNVLCTGFTDGSVELHLGTFSCCGSTELIDILVVSHEFDLFFCMHFD